MDTEADTSSDHILTCATWSPIQFYWRKSAFGVETAMATADGNSGVENVELRGDTARYKPISFHRAIATSICIFSSYQQLPTVITLLSPVHSSVHDAIPSGTRFSALRGEIDRGVLVLLYNESELRRPEACRPSCRVPCNNSQLVTRVVGGGSYGGKTRASCNSCCPRQSRAVDQLVS
jgi:hypothetical protein